MLFRSVPSETGGESGVDLELAVDGGVVPVEEVEGIAEEASGIDGGIEEEVEDGRRTEEDVNVGGDHWLSEWLSENLVQGDPGAGIEGDGGIPCGAVEEDIEGGAGSEFWGGVGDVDGACVGGTRGGVVIADGESGGGNSNIELVRSEEHTSELQSPC